MSPPQPSTAKETAKARADAAPEPPQAKARGYLAYEIPGMYGIGHAQGNLAMQLAEAYTLNRIPVAEAKANLWSFHTRHTGRARDRDFYWSDYILLDQGEVWTKGKDGGHGELVPWPFLVVDDLQEWIARQRDVRTLPGDAMPDPSEAAEVLLRTNTSVDGHRLTGFYADSLRDRYGQPDAEFSIPHSSRLPPAEHICAATARILEWLGKDFWFMHLRRGDWLPLASAKYTHASSSPQVAETLQMAGATQDTKIFLMTTERSPRFVKPLRDVCDLAWERECPPMQEFLRETQDNYQAYWAAIGITSHAKRLFTTRGLTLGAGHAEGPPPTIIQLPPREPMPKPPKKGAIYGSSLVEGDIRPSLKHWLHWAFLHYGIHNLHRVLAKIRRYGAK